MLKMCARFANIAGTAQAHPANSPPHGCLRSRSLIIHLCKILSPFSVFEQLRALRRLRAVARSAFVARTAYTETRSTSRVDTVHKDPCLVYWHHDSRRTNCILKRSPYSSLGAIACHARGTRSGLQTHRVIGEAKDTSPGVCESQRGQASRR